jgi:hypothetical protein
MSGGAVSGNTTANNGGGVWVDESSSFTMSGGKISGNEAGQGGGVYVRNNGSFTMTGSAVISGNTAGNSGGGVWVNGDGNFSKTGGIIYGDTDNIPYPTNGNATDNTAKGVYPGSGNAVYYNKDNGYYRDTTLDAGDNISTKNALPGNSGPEYGVNNWIKK